MKKKTKTLGILLGILVVLLAVFLGLKKWNAAQEEAEKAKNEAEKVSIYEAEALEKIAYEDSEGKSMSFEKTEEEWKYTPDTTIALDEETMSEMEKTFSEIKSEQEISEPDALEDYGLKDAQYRLTLTGDDGKERVILIGNTVGEDYYCMEEGQETVYTVSASLVSQMVWQISGVARKEQFVSVTEDSFVKEVVTKADGTETVYDSENEEQEETVSGVAGGLAGFYFTDCADYHVTDETLGDYGLEEANRTKVVLTYKDTSDNNEEKELTFYVGNMDEDEAYYYVQLEGSQMVNRVLASSVESALGWQ